MRIEFTFSRGPDYFSTIMVPGNVLRTRPLWVTGWFGVVAGLALAVLLGGELRALGVGAGLVLAGAALLLVRTWLIRADRVPESFLSSRRWLLTDEYVESRTDLTVARHYWAGFRAAAILDHLYMLFCDRGPMLDVPREPLTAEQDEQFAAFLRGRGLLGAQR
ncbi:YcxB family protein [Paractinoplanes durhamensis]|uniref:YcxB-like protein domain-containing protein n=1 Tax=Paractinoplanes durhamensis TaxID=113563 RepID=A0ABQ3YQT0_9ACTN|nr:YcxB family protein [Actinoplanes durhamensis]GID99941.1 hypothetical protein Adu01nite_12920 [Actinoplanes durhamensis]